MKFNDEMNGAAIAFVFITFAFAGLSLFIGVALMVLGGLITLAALIALLAPFELGKYSFRRWDIFIVIAAGFTGLLGCVMLFGALVDAFHIDNSNPLLNWLIPIGWGAGVSLIWPLWNKHCRELEQESAAQLPQEMAVLPPAKPEPRSFAFAEWDDEEPRP